MVTDIFQLNGPNGPCIEVRSENGVHPGRGGVFAVADGGSETIFPTFFYSSSPTEEDIEACRACGSIWIQIRY